MNGFASSFRRISRGEKNMEQFKGKKPAVCKYTRAATLVIKLRKRCTQAINRTGCTVKHSGQSNRSLKETVSVVPNAGVIQDPTYIAPTTI
jgi:hypothetical protein